MNRYVVRPTVVGDDALFGSKPGTRSITVRAESAAQAVEYAADMLNVPAARLTAHPLEDAATEVPVLIDPEVVKREHEKRGDQDTHFYGYY